MSETDLDKKYLKNDPVIQNFLARIPPQIAVTFTNTQLAEIKRVFGNRFTNSHRVDIRLSIPLLFKKGFYLVLLIGRDKRSKK